MVAGHEGEAKLQSAGEIQAREAGVERGSDRFLRAYRARARPQRILVSARQARGHGTEYAQHVAPRRSDLPRGADAARHGSLAHGRQEARQKGPRMIRHGYASANELQLHYAASGASDAPLLLFLHGFPEFWYAWRHQLEDLSGAYHCVAPDLPGYNLSSKPTEVARYRTKRLIDDVAAFAKTFTGKRKFTLIAHDWGGALAWAFAIKRPELIDRLIIINAVHPGAFQRELTKNPAQGAASQ